MKKFLALTLALMMIFFLFGCEEIVPAGTEADVQSTQQNANRLQANQPTPTDIQYSLERYNLIRRAYWVMVCAKRQILFPARSRNRWVMQFC